MFQVVDSTASTEQEMLQTRLKFQRWQASVGHKIATTDNAIKMAFKKFDTDGNGLLLFSPFDDYYLCLSRR